MTYHPPGHRELPPYYSDLFEMARAAVGGSQAQQLVRAINKLYPGADKQSKLDIMSECLDDPITRLNVLEDFRETKAKEKIDD